jgi:hypothetical protein
VAVLRLSQAGFAATANGAAATPATSNINFLSKQQILKTVFDRENIRFMKNRPLDFDVEQLYLVGYLLDMLHFVKNAKVTFPRQLKKKKCIISYLILRIRNFSTK